MVNDVLSKLEPVRCAARRADVCYILARDRQQAADEVAHALLLGMQRGKWARATAVRWNSTAIAVARTPREIPIFIGEDGEACFFEQGQPHMESLVPKPNMIRAARTISGAVYACGMNRQVYHRAGDSNWIDISAPPGTDDEVTSGFESMDGYGHDEIYAVGWSGEIWRRDGQAWRDCVSPTNVILTAACCAPDGIVYVAGQQGTLLKGRADAWELLDREDDVNVDLWDLCWFGDKLYVAAINDLFTLENGSLVVVDFGDDVPTTCFSLSAADGVLWSVGSEDVFAFDGNAWRRYA